MEDVIIFLGVCIGLLYIIFDYDIKLKLYKKIFKNKHKRMMLFINGLYDIRYKIKEDVDIELPIRENGNIIYYIHQRKGCDGFYIENYDNIMIPFNEYNNDKFFLFLIQSELINLDFKLLIDYLNLKYCIL
jgi:hypothetical protein